jgi:SAM-dependent methyltransferase
LPSCPACGNRNLKTRQLVTGLTTSTCSCCGLILGDVSRLGPVRTEFAGVDEAKYQRSVGGVRRLQAGQIRRFVEPLLPTGGNVVDVGCSFGYFLDEMRQAGYSIEGIEPDRQAYEAAVELLGADAVTMSHFTSESLPDSSTDALATLDVVEHIDPAEQGNFAHLVARALKPQGIWIIKVPTTEGLLYRLSYAATRIFPRAGGPLIRRLWQTEYEYVHTVYFNRRSLACWLNRFGFDVVAWNYLPEVPLKTVVSRLTTDGGITPGSAYVLAPVIAGINLIESARGRSDALLMIARKA